MPWTDDPQTNRQRTMKEAARHILIVDDNATIRKLLAEILQADGYTTSEASDGAEALELLEKTRVDAIVSDILMPNMDGYRFCYEVRRSRKHSTLPFIFLTAAYTSPGDEQHALDLGADRFLKKPLSATETLKVLREMFSNPLYRKPRAIKPIKEVEVIKQYTDRLVRKLEEKIVELHERTEELKTLSSALEQTADSVVITNKEGVIEYVNPAFEQNTGYKKEFAIGKTPAILKSGKQDAAFYEKLWKTILSGKVFREELVNRKRNGEFFYEQQTISPVLDNEGKVVHFVSTGRDITERKRADEKLQESMEQFRLIAENVTDLIVLLDVNGKRLYNSPSYKNILGDPRDLLGTDSFEEIHPDDRERMRNVFSNTLRTGIGQRTEFRFLTKDGSVRHIESQGSTIRDEQGKVSKVLVVSRDVTEKKKLEAQFLRAQRMESIGTLAGGIAHDLNNVLAPIMMGIEMLKSKVMDEGSQRMLRTLETSAQRGSGMVKQVLAFARGISGERVVLQAGHLIREMQKIVRETFPKSIQFRTEVPRGLWSVSADATQLHQVLLNLCVNARDAMPSGGALTITAENTVIDENYALMNVQVRTGPYVVLTVADTGTGIPPDLLDKVFDPFFTTKEIGKGTGLGLSTVHSIVKSHGGFINVYSEVGRGTKFRVYLPAETTAEEKQVESEQVELPAGHGELILLVDDEASIRDICRATLESYGYNVRTAADGTEAIVQYTQRMHDIQLVITDMMMPFMDGRATIEALCKINPEVKIIATSGFMPEEKSIDHHDLSICAFLAKPYTAAKLLTTVFATLARDEKL